MRQSINSPVATYTHSVISSPPWNGETTVWMFTSEKDAVEFIQSRTKNQGQCRLFLAKITHEYKSVPAATEVK